MNHKALVVIDIQNDITKHYRDIIDNINSAIDWSVSLGMTVIYIKHNSLSPGTRTFKPDTKGEALVPELKVVSPYIFVKIKANALTSVDFSEYIRENGIDEFYITGADATACVKSTCFNMTKAGYTVHVISDCVTSYNLKMMPEMLSYYADKGCEVKTLAEYMEDNKMNVTYEKKDAMIFIGYHTEIRPEEGYQKCPEFWDKEYAAKYARLWQTMRPETAVEKAILENEIGMFAICAESDNGFAYWIAGLYRGGAVPEGLELYAFPESEWAVFTTKGPMPDSLQTLNTAVWQEWFPTEGQKYNANGTATLEVYSAGNPHSPDYECGIWVPIERRGVD